MNVNLTVKLTLNNADQFVNQAVLSLRLVFKTTSLVSPVFFLKIN